jgi:hypothetical protein
MKFDTTVIITKSNGESKRIPHCAIDDNGVIWGRVDPKKIKDGRMPILKGDIFKASGLTQDQAIRGNNPEMYWVVGQNPEGTAIVEVPAKVMRARRTTCLNCGSGGLIVGRGYCTDCDGEC